MSEKYKSKQADHLVRKGLKFSQLRLLNALRDFEQIGAAAQHIGMTQPAASRLLSQLEEMVGVPLYTRHVRGISLTEAGTLLANQAASALHGFDLVQERIGQMAVGARGLVRIGAVTGPSLEILLPAVREARAAYPDVDLSVLIDTSDKLSEALLNRDLDFYIGRIPAEADARAFRIETIGLEPVALIVRFDHPLTRGRDIALKDCLDYDWVTQPPGGLLRRTHEEYLLKHGLELPRRVVGTTSVLFTLALVKETDAIAPMARAVADLFIERGALASRLGRLPLADDMRVASYGLVTRAGDPLGPAAERLFEIVQSVVKADTRKVL
ncbi:LysR family transcriptional regulator [Fulvimarina sp. MAC8]|uniref:LysR family transcriptional regulator n=1 Tax=Fulvimarina sp. MAC8 TaxID=3162874 RepID=UPI0032EBD740